MAYQSKYKGQEVEDILDNSLLKKEQVLTDDEKALVKENLGIKEQDLSDYATKKEVEDAISKIPTPDVGGQISAALVDYVKKVEGKGLSTNDFTNELKEKLEDITPYDPSELEAEIGKLEATINTLVGGNASNAIESFNEIIKFLENVSDQESLSGIIAGINTRIAKVEAKIPTKVSELENDKNYLTEHQSLSHLATKDELNAKQDKIEDLDAIREGASRAIPTKTSELTNDSGYLTEHQDISHLATKEELATTDAKATQASEQANQALSKANQNTADIDALKVLADSKAGAFHVENETGLFVIFKDEAAKSAYLTDGDESGVLGKFALGGAQTDTVYMMTVNTANEQYNFTTSSEKMEITAGFTSQVKYTDEEGYIEFKEAAIFSVSVIKSGSETVVVSSGNIVKQGETFTFDVKPYVGNGENTVIITAEGLVSASKGVVAVSVSVTSMALIPMNFEWNKPYVGGTDYRLGGLKILGTLDKVLHIRVTGDAYSKDYQVNIGTAQYDEVAYGFDGLEHPDATGIYKVEMWLEATESGLLSETLTYRIMCIKADEASTAQLICINEVATQVLNYSESKIFSYAVYNGGASTATPTIAIHKDSDIIASNTLNVNTGVIHDYVYSFALSLAESSAQIGVFATFGNEQAAILTLINETTLAPVAGYSFYMDAATRGNGDESREYFINELTQEKVSASWVDMAWVNGMDGWTTDNEGNKCLLVPAMSSAEVQLTPMKNVSTVTIEMLYKVSNVSDFNEDIITILKETTSSWMGMRIKPTNITLHSQSLFTEDLKQGYNTKDEEMVHLVTTIVSNYSGIGNVAMIYVNGVKKCSFEWAKGDTFAHDGVLKLGSQTADLYLYKMRVYGFAFSWQQVMQNYIASIVDVEKKTLVKRKEDSVLNDANELDYDKIYGNYNTFVVELPTGAQLPNRKNNPSNSAIEGTNLYINIVQDPNCSIQGDWLNIPLEGQGTTAMTYYRWNLRTKTSSAYGKFRITAKKNVASSMHSHKMGATRLYNDLNQAIVGLNEAEGRVAVYQYPVYGFQKIENEDKPGTYYYQFIGLYTVGPDKGDKSTFGYDDDAYKDTLIHMEGTDHSPRGVGMEYPWEEMTVGLNEDGDAFIGAKGTDGGMEEGAWEIGACGDKESVDDMKAYLDVEFAPAYKLEYECTPMLVGLPSGTSIDDVNANVKDFRSQTADNGFAYADCHVYIDGEYDLYYFNIVSQTYVKDGRKVYVGLDNYGFSLDELDSKATTLDKTNYLRECRKARYKAEAGNYWLVDDSIFHACFLDLIGATDNEKKNSYPYKFGTLASGSRWRWRQDDLDTIFDVNNQGSADKKYSIMNTDKSGEGMIFKGNTSYHWRCIREYYKDEYKAMMKTIMNKMVELCPNGYGTSQIQKLVGCIKKYFWDYAQEYFTGGAYNIDAKWTYEDTWAIYQNDKSVNAVHPLQQSLGSHYEAEVSWVTLRMLFLASMNEFGAFVDYVDSSEGQVSFRQGGDFTFSLTPAIDMRPSVIQGKNSKKIHADGRVMAGDSVTITMPTDTSADTMVYIQGADWLSDIGDFSKVQIGSSDKTFAVTSKRIKKIKVGDENADEVTTNIGKLDVGYCPSVTEVEARNVAALTDNVDLSKCPRLRIARFGGTSVNAIVLPDGAKIQEYDLPSSLIRLSLRKLPLLTTEGLTYDSLNALSYLWVEDNKHIEGYDLLKTALDGGSPLNNIRVIGFDHTGDATDITFLMTLADGNYHGIDADGNNVDSSYPIIEGKLHIAGNLSEDNYNLLTEKFPALVLTADVIISYFKFADSEVSRIVAENWGDGMGTTLEQIEAITDIGTKFSGNTLIESFDEFEKFTGVTAIEGAFKDSTLKEISLPVSLETIGTSAFQNTDITNLTIEETVTEIGDSAFAECEEIESVVMKSEVPCTLGSGAFASSSVDGGNGGIYVPQISLYSYRGATNWLEYSGNIYPYYPTGVQIEAPLSIDNTDENVITLAFDQEKYLYPILESYWFLDGSFDTEDGTVTVTPTGNLTIVSSDTSSCTIQAASVTDTPVSEQIGVRVTFTNGEILYGVIKIWYTTDEVIMTDETNAPVLAVLYANGMAANEDVMTKSEAEAVTDIGTLFKGNTSITSFDEFKYFTGVTNLADGAFNQCTKIKDLRIPDGVTQIGGSGTSGTGAISEMTSLETLHWGKNITKCNGLNWSNNIKNIYVYDNFNYLNVNYGRGESNPLCESEEYVNLFVNGVKTTEFVIPEGVTNIPSRANALYNLNINKIHIPASLTTFNLTTSTSGSFLKECPPVEFEVDSSNEYFASINGVLYNKSVTTLYRAAGEGEELIIPSSVTYIVENCVSYSHYKKIRVHSGITRVDTRLFSFNNSIKILIWESTTNLPQWTVDECKSLETILIKAEIKSIGNVAFINCSNLRNLIVDSSNLVTLTNWGSNTGFNKGIANAYVQSNLVDSYKTATTWSTYADKIKPINVADTLPDIGSVAENDLYKIGEIYWKAELVDDVLTWVEL